MPPRLYTLFIFTHCMSYNTQALIPAHINTSESRNNRYPQLCADAAKNDKVFATFRQQLPYREIVETLAYDSGLEFAAEIQNRYPHLLNNENIKRICHEDKVGGPLQYTFKGIGLISPTVLRYIKVFGDLQQIFGDMRNWRIIEIGGGCGIQCKIIHDFSGFLNYTIVDLPECTSLIRKYIAQFSIKNTHTISTAELHDAQNCDLVISNYAFSEIHREGQAYYIEKIIKNAPHGYMIYNHFHHMNPLSLNEFVNLLKSYGKKVRVIHENPHRTGDIIIWTS